MGIDREVLSYATKSTICATNPTPPLHPHDPVNLPQLHHNNSSDLNHKPASIHASENNCRHIVHGRHGRHFCVDQLIKVQEVKVECY